MPQATDEMREKMRGRFGSIDTSGPEKYLTERGYVLTPEYLWRWPSPQHQPTGDELDCIEFLVDEWDYGGFE